MNLIIIFFINSNSPFFLNLAYISKNTEGLLKEKQKSLFKSQILSQLKNYKIFFKFTD